MPARRAAARLLAYVFGAGAAVTGARAAAAVMVGAVGGGWPAPRDGGGRFTNPWESWTGDKRLGDVFEFGRQMRALGVPNWGHLTANRRPSRKDMRAAFPLHAPDYPAVAAPPPGSLAALWAGHASVLFSLDGLALLTDPVFARRASPLRWLGPERAVPAPVAVEDPGLRVDAVLISHNHYDHLCDETVKRLHRRFGPGLAWYVPLGLAGWFRRRGIANVTELDWWQEVQHPGSKVRLVLTPAQHWSARTPFDTRRTLWGGWAALGERRRFWFAGDTGHAPGLFEEIGQRLGPFDLAAIPIGAYEPRGFMAPQHVGPREAVAIHRAVRARRSIGVHCCTFHLTLEPLDEPPALLASEAAAAGLAPDEFVVLQHGATITVRDGEILTAPLHTLPLPAPAAAAAARPTPGAAIEANPGGSGGGGEL
ncbi:N-acyl-phosphatidylethanolamine-hydrolyzing phospholipase D [Raphidocelis subcapitata]|uniref:N-acyl-phosphatidylethanolamine-hydrolyzing phospholipase D n=1 Tax=Raphidocelis subcapitata TaxID=307507 RepID=A0A2V0NVA1_9CHLO|nr:N-acyl-phosphatidylethanolamine-hydrolyzing phospholipase D [Raphidocelis subcapitata]|eukprot:GBF91566.1 N-acyl-phosphatidylethanolamine-hydrolyzing phospholipase D [Raphidocelis subcapitata]